MESAIANSGAKPEVTVVVPTYKEAQNVRPLVAELARALAEREGGYEVIFVDDDSRDGICREVEVLSADGFPARLITRLGERGLSTAVLRGFDEAAGRILVCMDADLSHPPAAIPEMLRSLEDSEIDMALGSRYVPGASTEEGWGLFRWLNSKVATLLARPFTKVRDPMSGFFAIRRETYDKAGDLDPVGYKIGLELLVRCNCRNVREIPIRFSKRRAGASKLTLGQQWNYIKHLKRLADYKFGPVSQFLQFCAVGSSGVAVDLSIFAALLTFLPFRPARALAIWAAMTWNYFLNRWITFSSRLRATKLTQYPRFVATCSLGALVNWTVADRLRAVSQFFAQHLLLAAFVGILAGMTCNFLICRRYVFRRQRASTKEGS
ncbi:MAG: glycosyltransferase [Planctomycetota bacterium]|jgi:dolichol-phosphate mannosyltransferase